MRKAALGANHGLWGRNKRSNHGFHVLPPSVEVTAVSRTPLRAGFHICGQEFPRSLCDPRQSRPFHQLGACPRYHI